MIRHYSRLKPKKIHNKEQRSIEKKLRKLCNVLILGLFGYSFVSGYNDQAWNLRYLCVKLEIMLKGELERDK